MFRRQILKGCSDKSQTAAKSQNLQIQFATLVDVQLRLPWSSKAPASNRVRVLDVNGRTFPIQIARHQWARRYVLRVTAEGALRLTVPRGASITAGVAFAEKESAWVAAEWARLQARAAWHEGATVWYRGARVTLTGEGADVRCGDQRITGAARRDWRTAIQRHWRAEAIGELPARCLVLARHHGLEPMSVRVRDQRSRWGACSGRGAITLNWRLVQMPPHVADYVMLHELAHLRQPNHSRRFWREVESLCPDWRAAERWLKAFGRDLL